MLLKVTLIFLMQGIVIFCKEDERFQLRLSGGLIEGRVVKFGDRSALAFMGVPYAEAPIESLRFKPTRLKHSWNTTLDATKYASSCAQRTTESIYPLENSSEDCLHINIYADQKCLTKACPILFYIHGGLYLNSPTMFDETLIMKNFALDEIVFVMPAYRLGIFGFMNLGYHDRSDAPLNAGILDLISALRWTQLEAHNFGGDSRQITVVGNSDGANLALILINSPLVEPMAFKSAIISSGMFEISKGQSRQMSEEVLEQVGCGRDRVSSLSGYLEKVACLRSKSTDELLDAMADSEPKWKKIIPQIDNHIIPFNSAEEYLKNWRGIRLMIITTEDETELSNQQTVEDKCRPLVESFGYSNPKSVNACIEYYTTVSNLNLTFQDAYHAFMHKLASVNTKLGYDTFAGIFAQPNGKKHSDDLKYLLGLNPIPDKDKNKDDYEMEEFYPMILRKFVKSEGNEMDDWLPTDEYGRNYYWMRFLSNPKSSKILDWPRMMHGEFFRPLETHFWMEQLQKINDGIEEIIEAVRAQESASGWAAFWLVLGICVVLAVALSTVIVFWLTVRLRAAGVVIKAHNGVV